MDKRDKIRKYLRENDMERLSGYSYNTIGNLFLDILDQDISSFSYDQDIELDYLDNLVKLLPRFIEKNPKVSKADEKLRIIHQKIKTFLVQKPGYIDKTNHNYKILKNMINEIELIQMSLLYDYVSKYEGSKYELLNCIIFDTKKISVFNDLINRFPYIVNYFDKDGKNLIVSVIEEYINEVMNYTKEKGVDSITYYGQVISTILKSSEFMFDVVDKQTILKKIRELYKDIEDEKETKIFHLNSLVEKINNNEIEPTNSFLEYKYNIPTIFNEAINSEVRRVVNSYSIGKDRTEVDDYILSFDGEDTKEIDDALSIKVLDNGNIELGVHIADPLDMIDVDSIIFEEAIKRTTSIYLSDKTIPMFPKEISTDLVSLKEKNYRPATSYYFEFDKYGNEVNIRLVKSIIKVNRNMTYSDFNHISNMKSNDKLKRTIDNLSLVSNILKRYYNVDPLYERVNRETSNVSNTNITGGSSGERVIESSMVYTNYRIAKFCHDKGIPINFRNHFLNQEELDKYEYFKHKILKEHNDDSYTSFIDMVKGMYPKAIYGIECYGHFGLGVPYYSHFTSPIRRSNDDGNIYSLNKIYFSEHDEKDIKKVNELILKISNYSNGRRDSIEKFTKEYEENKKRI